MNYNPSFVTNDDSNHYRTLLDQASTIFSTAPNIVSEGMVTNQPYGRRELGRLLTDPRRNIAKECGHPETMEINQDQYWHFYERNAIAARVVEVMAKESWQVTPLVYETEDVQRETPFEQAWDKLSVMLRGIRSWHKQEQGSLVWPMLKKADVLAGVGHFGIILLGFDDVGKMNERGARIELYHPMKEVMRSYALDLLTEDKGTPIGAPTQGPTNDEIAQDIAQQYTVPQTPTLPTGATDDGGIHQTQSSIQEATDALSSPQKERTCHKLLFIRVFPEYLVKISKYDTNPSSPRFTQPIQYMITFNDPHVTHGGIGIQQTTKYVHWTRVVHIADGDHQASASEVAAAPRVRPVVDNILDLEKLYGSSAEMYWRGAFPGMSFETIPQLGANPTIDVNKLRDMYEAYINGLDRGIYTKAMTVKPLSPTVVDPTPQINVHIEAICIKLGIPKRIFMGSERGELASSQDDSAWNDRLKARQETFITPNIIVPFIDRLIMAKVLPEPENGYFVKWPDLTSKSDQEKATVALTLTQALVAWANGNGEAHLTFSDFLVRFLGLDEAEAQAIVKRAQEQQMGMEPTVPEDTRQGQPGGSTAVPPSSPSVDTTIDDEQDWLRPLPETPNGDMYE